MTDHQWWACKSCGEPLYDSRAVYAHRSETGHVGASVLSDKVPTAGPGSSDEARAAALEAARKAVREAKVKGGRL